jgi:regulator of sigma E protease
MGPLQHYLPWLAPIVVFGLVIFVHELGHFLAAKAVGVYTPRFSIGFGPSLWSHRWGETEYRIAALPLGGYVRMASREDEAVAMLEGGAEEPASQDSPSRATGDPTAMMPFGPLPIPADRWFESKPLTSRLFIMLAGVSMNAVLTIVILAGLFLHMGRPTPSNATVIDRVLEGSPAARAGLAAGDSVELIGSDSVRSWQDLVARVSKSAGVPLVFTVSRNGAQRTVTVTPHTVADTDRATHEIHPAVRIGAAQRLDPHPMPLGQAFGQAWTVTWQMVGETLHALRDIVTRREPLSSLQGPLGIAKYSIDAARSGTQQLFLLIALLSINVAVFNLLPIPILDGGQILVNVAEAIKGRPFSLQTRETILRIGLVAIGLLFVLVMFNDRCRVFSALC